MAREAPFGVYIGCTLEWRRRAQHMDQFAKWSAHELLLGNSLPTECILAGEKFDVVTATGLVADDNTDNQSAFQSAVGGARARPTLVVIPPAARPYRYSGEPTSSANTYVCGHYAIVKPRAVPPRSADDLARDALGKNLSCLESVCWRPDNNCGYFGITFMAAVREAYSKWPERHLADPTKEGAKNGFWSSSADGHGRSDAEAWILASSKSNLAIVGCDFNGSLTGALRAHNCKNGYLANCSSIRGHSDTFHIVKQSEYWTVEHNNVFDSGDDCISFIEYNTASGPPRYMLTQFNNCKRGRGRGLVTAAGMDMCFRWNEVSDMNLAGALVHTADAHSLNSAERIQFVDNTFWRNGRKQANDAGNSAPGVLLRGGGTYAVKDIYARRNKCYMWNDWYSAGSAVATSGSPITNVDADGSNTVTELDETD